MCMCTLGSTCCIGVIAAVGVWQWKSKKDEEKEKKKEHEDDWLSELGTSKVNADGDVPQADNSMLFLGIGVVVVAGIAYAVLSGGDKNGGKIAAVEVEEETETNWDAADW